MRARPRFILICAGSTAVLTALTAVIVSVYAGLVHTHRVVPDRVQLRRARRADPELEQCRVFISTAAGWWSLLGIWALIALAARSWSDVVVWTRFRLSRIAAGHGGGRLAAGEPGGP